MAGGSGGAPQSVATVDTVSSVTSVGNIADAKADPIETRATPNTVGLAENESVTVPQGKVWHAYFAPDSNGGVSVSDPSGTDAGYGDPNNQGNGFSGQAILIADSTVKSEDFVSIVSYWEFDA